MARLQWGTVLRTSRARIEALKPLVREVYAHRPEVSQQVEKSLKKLDGVISLLEGRLYDELDDVVNAETERERSRCITEARQTALDFLDFAAKDPVAAAIDNNGMDDGTPIMAPVRASLAEISKALGA